MGFVWDLIKIGVGVAFIFLVVFLIFSGKFGGLTPVIIVVFVLIAIALIFYYIYKYRKTTIEVKGKPIKDHEEYLKLQIKRNRVGGSLAEFGDKIKITDMPDNMAFDMIIGRHHVVNYKGLKGRETSIYDIDADSMTGTLYDDSIDSRNYDKLIKIIEMLEQVKKGEKLKITASPQLIQETIKEIEKQPQEEKKT